MAKIYQKPEMKVIKVKVQKLLAGSDGGGGTPVEAPKQKLEDFYDIC